MLFLNNCIESNESLFDIQISCSNYINENLSIMSENKFLFNITSNKISNYFKLHQN